ncbi:MAG: glycosyl hydrolase family 28-related protein, partial [Tepidisphaeraceae bacterium]
MIRPFQLIALTTLLYSTLAIAQTQPPTTININYEGAIGDGKTVNTAAIQKAIDECAAAGGGRVEIPAGAFLTGPFDLRSNIDLHLDPGSLLIFTRNFDDYPLVFATFMGKDTVQCRSPITGKDLQNVSITGPGIIDGQGDAWRPLKKSKVSDQQWSDQLKSGGVVDDKNGIWYPTQAAMD